MKTIKTPLAGKVFAKPARGEERASVSGSDIRDRCKPACHLDKRHRLKDDLSGACYDRVEKTFTAEEDILDALYGHDVDRAGVVHHDQVSGVDDLLFSCR